MVSRDLICYQYNNICQLEPSTSGMAYLWRGYKTRVWWVWVCYEWPYCRTWRRYSGLWGYCQSWRRYSGLRGYCQSLKRYSSLQEKVRILKSVDKFAALLTRTFSCLHNWILIPIIIILISIILLIIIIILIPIILLIIIFLLFLVLDIIF